MRISVMGPQGSGKSTQAKILAVKFNLCYISSGELLRELAQEDSEDGRLIKSQMDQGILVDDHVLARIIKQKIEECGGNFVMDGYPRRLSQIDAYDPLLEKVFFIDVPDEVVIERLMARGRFDDTEAGIKTRLDVYYKETKPVIDHYEKEGIINHIKGEGSIDEIAERILAHLNG